MVAKIQADEISSIIKERIDNFELSVDINETGKIVSYADGVAQVYGLSNVMAGEMVEFDEGTQGLVMNLEESTVGVVILGSGNQLKEGMSVKRLGRLLKVPVGDALLGRVVNALIELRNVKCMSSDGPLLLANTEQEITLAVDALVEARKI